MGGQCSNWLAFIGWRDYQLKNNSNLTASNTSPFAGKTQSAAVHGADSGCAKEAAAHSTRRKTARVCVGSVSVAHQLGPERALAGAVEIGRNLNSFRCYVKIKKY
jgi:hypothetical protein